MLCFSYTVGFPGSVPALAKSRDPTEIGPTILLEPILFPKLRIEFADFPYLRCPGDERLFTLETCCGAWYDPSRASKSSNVSRNARERQTRA